MRRVLAHDVEPTAGDAQSSRPVRVPDGGIVLDPAHHDRVVRAAGMIRRGVGAKTAVYAARAQVVEHGAHRLRAVAVRGRRQSRQSVSGGLYDESVHSRMIHRRRGGENSVCAA